jgi:hypothetical protein
MRVIPKNSAYHKAGYSIMVIWLKVLNLNDFQSRKTCNNQDMLYKDE